MVSLQRSKMLAFGHGEVVFKDSTSIQISQENDCMICLGVVVAVV